MGDLRSVNHCALVTGAASGLGYEFAKLLAIDGCKLVLVDIDMARLEESAEKLEEEYKIKVRPVLCDLALPDAAEKLYELVKDDNVNILINNAGYGLSGLFNETRWEHEERMMYLHMYTPTRFIKLILNDIIASGGGRIMNIASVSSFTPGPLMSVYFATKAYLLSFGNALSNELKGTGVTVTTACPGLIRTRFKETRASYSSIKAPEPGIMSDSAEKVAKIAYRAMLKGRIISIPVLKNRFMAFLTWMTPRPLAVKFVRASMNKFHKL